MYSFSTDIIPSSDQVAVPTKTTVKFAEINCLFLTSNSLKFIRVTYDMQDKNILVWFHSFYTWSSLFYVAAWNAAWRLTAKCSACEISFYNICCRLSSVDSKRDFCPLQTAKVTEKCVSNLLKNEFIAIYKWNHWTVENNCNNSIKLSYRKSPPPRLSIEFW